MTTKKARKPIISTVVQTVEMPTPQTYHWIFAETEGGQRIMNELTKLFFDIQSYTQNDPYHTTFLEGQRSVVRHILLKIMNGAKQEQGEPAPND